MEVCGGRPALVTEVYEAAVEADRGASFAFDFNGPHACLMTRRDADALGGDPRRHSPSSMIVSARRRRALGVTPSAGAIMYSLEWRHAVGAFFVFLNLLECDAGHLAEVCLIQLACYAGSTDTGTDCNVKRMRFFRH